MSPLCLQTEQRYRELTAMGLKVKLVLVGNKGKQYFQRRPQYDIVSECQTSDQAVAAAAARCSQGSTRAAPMHWLGLDDQPWCACPRTNSSRIELDA
jgi:hypothetical protein